MNFSLFRQEFPVLFGAGQFISLCVGEGWFFLLWDLCAELESITRLRVADGHAPLRVVEIKEKYGSLRVYIEGGTDEANAIIEAAETKSKTICEACGRPGNSYTIYGSDKTVCPFHELVARHSDSKFQEGLGAK